MLTEPGLSTIVDAIIIARRIFRRIAAFLNYRIAATLQLLLFFFIAVFAFEPHRYNPQVRDQIVTTEGKGGLPLCGLCAGCWL